MSMLTPPGMPGKRFRVRRRTKPFSFAKQRHTGRRRVLLSGGALALAALLAWGGAQLADVFGGRQARQHTATAPGAAAANQGSDSDSNTAPLRCTLLRGAPHLHPPADKPTAKPARPSDVTVTVLNATTRGGLAKKAADELKSRGFAVKRFGNAPSAKDGKVKQAAQLVGGDASAGARLTLSAQLGGPADARQLAKISVTKQRAGRSVNLLIGDAWHGLAKTKVAVKRLSALSHVTAKRRTQRGVTATEQDAYGC